MMSGFKLGPSFAGAILCTNLAGAPERIERSFFPEILPCVGRHKEYASSTTGSTKGFSFGASLRRNVPACGKDTERQKYS